MCGFAGVVTWDDRYRVSPETLAKMSAAVAHRGPDGEGSYINHQEEVTVDRPQVAMAFRRLAILDPDPRSNQPFTDGRFWLVFNGEIYNFRELRKELTGLRPNYQWRTTGDTEVLLCAFAVWGEKCVEHLNGMFAFVVWDEREKSLFLARDRMGQKPLFVAGFPNLDPNSPTVSLDGPCVAFASEISALQPLHWWDRTLSSGIYSYLSLGYIPHRTIFHGMQKVEPSVTVHVRAAQISVRHYFRSYKSFRENQPESNAIGQTRERVTEAVRRQLVTDVPLGCFLSGGIDSSVIALSMTRSVPRTEDVMTFAIGFDDPRYDESGYASAVAKHLGTSHRTFHVRANAAADLPLLATIFGEPFADSSALPAHYLSRESRAYLKVALGGEGGDELFGGYDRYRAMGLAAKLPGHIWRSASIMARCVFRGTHPKSRSARIRRFFESAALAPGQRYARWMRIFQTEQIDSLVGRKVSHSPDNLAGLFDIGSEARPIVPNALAVDRVSYLPDDLLTKVDRCSMMHGLEVRSPFMDHELVQFAAGLTTDQLLKGGPKRMLREAFAADLPAWVFKRKKMGFAVPIGEWFRGELRPMLRDSLFAGDSFASGNFNKTVVQRLVDEHEQQRVDHSQRLYALLMLELWWNTVKK